MCTRLDWIYNKFNILQIFVTDREPIFSNRSPERTICQTEIVCLQDKFDPASTFSSDIPMIISYKDCLQ